MLEGAHHPLALGTGRRQKVESVHGGQCLVEGTNVEQGAVDIEADRLGELRHRHHVVFAVVPDGVRVPIGDVLAAVPVDGEATQGPRELGALGRADARDLLLHTHLAADGVHRDDGTAVLGAHLEPARLVGHVDHRVRVLEGAARRLALRADAPQVRAQTRVDARAEEDERRVVGVAVGHDEQPGGGRHAARHVHERVALVGGGARVGAAQREAVHARDAVRGVAHGLARVGRAVEGQVEEGRQRVGRVVQAGQVRAAIRVILLDATDGDARGEQHADDAGDGEDGRPPAALIGAVPSLREQLAPAYKLRRAPRDDKQTEQRLHRERIPLAVIHHLLCERRGHDRTRTVGGADARPRDERAFVGECHLHVGLPDAMLGLRGDRPGDSHRA
mmetsp:Transcript_38137/g.91409  ORF Transcript_38137/g.91409 Transcript_38137/m.91409 type:complete len:390 (+) Transcript_38137:276-1445(+)